MNHGVFASFATNILIIISDSRKAYIQSSQRWIYRNECSRNELWTLDGVGIRYAVFAYAELPGLAC